MVVETEVKPFTILTHMSSIRSLTPFTALDPREHITQAVPELFPLLPFITQHTHIHTPPWPQPMSWCEAVWEQQGLPSITAPLGAWKDHLFQEDLRSGCVCLDPTDDSSEAVLHHQGKSITGLFFDFVLLYFDFGYYLKRLFCRLSA